MLRFSSKARVPAKVKQFTFSDTLRAPPLSLKNPPKRIFIVGQALSGLITVLEDKEYMVTLREKMNNIKKVAKFYNYDLLLAKK